MSTLWLLNSVVGWRRRTSGTVHKIFNSFQLLTDLVQSLVQQIDIFVDLRIIRATYDIEFSHEVAGENDGYFDVRT
jgi:hypothetical protein